MNLQNNQYLFYLQGLVSGIDESPIRALKKANATPVKPLEGL